MAPVPNNSGMYMWCSGMNSRFAGETVANEVCVCVCVCVQEMARRNRKNRVTQWLKLWKIKKKNPAGNTLQYH
jgi:hypothetical protein